MIDPLDRHSRDSTLFQFTTKRMSLSMINVSVNDQHKCHQLDP